MTALTNQNKYNNNHLTLSQFNNKFKSLIQTPFNNSKYPHNTKQIPNTQRSDKPSNLTHSDLYSSQQQNLNQQLLKENAELKFLLQQAIQKINNLQSLQKDVNEIKKNVLDNKEKIIQTNMKVDIIISRTEELNQNILNAQSTDNNNPITYKRKKEKLLTPNTNDFAKKYSFNPQIDSFSDIGGLKTISSIANNKPTEPTTNKFSLPLNPTRHLINETESEYMDSINYE
ncbi:hypothetical protein C1645_841420 [Glomus cerebriforme]|uniref:Uncharacterized protein n=1 Tax=Glomus cerebriforme TaxID=658196 RepID=A0A397S459_9GLOM|nr:hypothetical protein C1645_841420 [Glomus cerebriforme]